MVMERTSARRNFSSLLFALVAMGAAYAGCSGESRDPGITTGGGSLGSGTSSSSTSAT